MGIFSIRHRIQTGSGAHPASFPINTGGSYPEIRRPGREDDHSPPSSAEINARSYNAISQYVLIAWCLIKQAIRIHSVVLGSAQGQLYILPLSLIIF